MLAFVFCTFFVVSFGLALVAVRPARQEKQIRARVAALVPAGANGVAAAGSDELLSRPAQAGLMARIEALADRSRFQPRLLLLIQQAHVATTPGRVIASSAIILVVAALLLHLAAPSLPLLMLLALPAAGFPVQKLRFQRSRYLRRFDAALPDGIDLLSRSLRAGHSVSSAIEVVSEQGTEPVSSEFGEVFRAQNFGLPFRDAILQLSARVPSKDLRFLVTAMMVQKETGGNLTEILDRTTHIIRERLRIQGEVRTKTAQGRLTGWILSVLPILLGGMINLINPGYAGPMLHDPMGRKMLYTAAGMISVGAWLISRIVRIEV